MSLIPDLKSVAMCVELIDLPIAQTLPPTLSHFRQSIGPSVKTADLAPISLLENIKTLSLGKLGLDQALAVSLKVSSTKNLVWSMVLYCQPRRASLTYTGNTTALFCGLYLIL